MDWVNEFPAAISVCDTEGVMLVINNKEAETLKKMGGKELIGKNLFDCHSRKSNEMICEQMRTQETRVYVVEEHGKRELFIQAPWYQEGKFSGLVELVLEFEGEINTISRK